MSISMMLREECSRCGPLREFQVNWYLHHFHTITMPHNSILRNLTVQDSMNSVQSSCRVHMTAVICLFAHRTAHSFHKNRWAVGSLRLSVWTAEFKKMHAGFGGYYRLWAVGISHSSTCAACTTAAWAQWVLCTQTIACFSSLSDLFIQ